MARQDFNRTFGLAPILMSLLATALVVIAVTTGWQTNLPDEGLAAHLFQLLIFSQPLVVFAFLATADWKHAVQVAVLLALQVLAAAVALGTLWYFEARGL
jgi:hypothetical protein